MNEVDGDKLNGLVGKMLGDLGGAFSVPTVRIGYRLGLFDALHKDGPATAAELAKRTGLAARYVREWALAQAANGYIMFNAADERFSLTPEQAMVFTVKNSPVYLEGAFDLSAAMVEGQSKVEAAFRTGAGVAWGESSGCLFCAVGAFFRPGYVNAIAQSWLPAIEGAMPELQAGAKVADIGCGVGFSTLLMAEAFPKKLVHRLRLPRSVDRAGERPRQSAWRCRPCPFRGCRCQKHNRAELRPDHHVRLPSRHG